MSQYRGRALPPSHPIPPLLRSAPVVIRTPRVPQSTKRLTPPIELCTLRTVGIARSIVDAFEWGLPLFAILEVAALCSLPSILLRRRGQPRSALAWTLALITLPLFSLLAWWLFGRTRLERKKKRRITLAQRAKSQLEAAPSIQSNYLAQWLPSRAHQDSAFASEGNHVALLCDGHEAFAVIEKELRAAKSSISIEFYIFRLDETGERIATILQERADEGVSTRVLVDGFGSGSFISSLRRRFKDTAVQFSVFLPSRLSPLTAPRANFINHRKIIVIDGCVGFTGGMNIANEYRDQWHDLMLSIRGPAVSALNQILLEDWFFATRELVSDLATRVAPAGKDLTGVIASGPDTEPWIHDSFFLALSQAKKSIQLVTPYFIPTEALRQVLRTAAGRGIEVELLLPADSDVRLVKWASRSFYRELVGCGVKIREYQGKMIHAKAMMIDDRLLSVGSANLDLRSMRLSFEVACFVDSPPLAQTFYRWLLSLREDSVLITKEDLETKPASTQLVESIASLFSPLL
ncbi:MAG: cardiolipin synthase [Polyangiaceae bacterium]|nr:cardiolipin synthase [Polyangiaceae bacterium]